VPALVQALGLALILIVALVPAAYAQTPAAWDARAALTGTVTSAAEGPMEGVSVIARRTDAAVLVAVSSDARGQYQFPRARLQPGHYQISIRAAGYTLEGGVGSAGVEVTSGAAPTRLDLPLNAVTDPLQLASQLTTLEWVNSFPGSAADKDLLVRNMVNCGFCHSLERVARSTHSADDFRRVIQRMKTYETDHSSAERIQVVAPPEPIEQQQWYGREAAAIAAYLATVNLSQGQRQWQYPLQTLPRPRAEATRALVTVYPIPRQPSVIHDLDVDSRGNVWYGNTGWDYIGRLDPHRGEFAEWAAPNFLPEAAPGLQRIVGVQDIQVDPADHVWVAVGGNKHAKFVPETGRWQTYDLPVVWKNPFLGPVRSGESYLWATGITAPPEGERRHEHAFRLDVTSGKLMPGVMLFDDKPAPTSPHHANQLNYCYMMDQDADGNFLCTVPEASAIARADATGKVRLLPTPTPYGYPRRGYRDDQNRFWFGEFFNDKIGVLDLHTDTITEYPVGPTYISPYYARPDNRGFVWISSTGSDRLLRLNPATGAVTQYLMPVSYDARKVVVDESAPHTTIWLPNKNLGQLIRVEIPD
jgi:streptogramin lyase